MPGGGAGALQGVVAAACVAACRTPCTAIDAVPCELPALLLAVLLRALLLSLLALLAGINGCRQHMDNEERVLVGRHAVELPLSWMRILYCWAKCRAQWCPRKPNLRAHQI